MKKLQTKQALTLAVVAMALCLTMLVGTTFAWFTDGVTAPTTEIVVGSLNVELEYSYDGVTWAPVTQTTDLFAGTNSSGLWEPGYTQYVYLKISNLGNLALKYALDIKHTDTVTGTNIKGADFKLSDHVMFGAVSQTDSLVTFDTREAAVAAVTDTTNQNASYGWLSDVTYAVSGDVSAATAQNDTAKYISLVIWMPTSVGNDANPQVGTTAPKITLGLSLQATQADEESDAFGTGFDQGAPLN